MINNISNAEWQVLITNYKNLDSTMIKLANSVIKYFNERLPADLPKIKNRKKISKEVAEVTTKKLLRFKDGEKAFNFIFTVMLCQIRQIYRTQRNKLVKNKQ